MGIFGQEISGVAAIQKGNNIEISYDLKSDAPCDVFSYVSFNSGKKWEGPLTNVKGDIGDFVLEGKKRFEWEVLKTREDFVGSEIQFKVVAKKVDVYHPKMVKVEGGIFEMGSSEGEQDEMPIHQVEVSSFEIGKYEVTQYEWRVIMGSNPSYHNNCDNCPVESVSWYEIQSFLNRLYELTGDIYRLPTEAEWEYAAKGGIHTKGYVYSGSNLPNEVSWFGENSNGNSHPVGELLPNELGLFDMSGNAQERCWDWVSEYKTGVLENPTGPKSGRYKSIKGGSWADLVTLSRVSDRDGDEPISNGFDYGFRMVKSKNDFREVFNYETEKVAGGTFQMGCEDYSDKEKPMHSVTLNAYNIGKYEITQAQWKAVMGGNPSFFNECDECPVEQVSYHDALEFIKRLNQITGKFYRLPTEAEWEFAAIGGAKLNGYAFSGSNNIDDVAWYDGNSITRTNQVGKKKPNGIGIYDMSGNVQEWCSDFLGSYSIETSHNPSGPLKGEQRIIRGGGYNVNSVFAKNGVRNNAYPESRYTNLGLRLVHPIFDLKSIEPETVLVEGGTFQMGSNSGEEDEKPVHAVTVSSFKMAKYEVTQSQWKLVMGNNPSQFPNCDECPVENVSFNDIQEYIKRLNSITGKRYRLPTEAEWEYAARGGSKSMGFQFSGSNDINAVAWHNGNSENKVHLIGTKKANELGIYDMSGNVWEWTLDKYSSYGDENAVGAGGFVIRGGSFRNNPNNCSVSDRFGFEAIDSNGGFRLVLPIFQFHN